MGGMISICIRVRQLTIILALFRKKKLLQNDIDLLLLAGNASF